MIWKPSTTNTELIPALALRLLAPADRHHTAGAGANRYGTITDSLRPISLSIGGDGATLSCRVPRNYAVCSDPDYLHQSLAGYWATLEYRPNSDNKALQKVLFRGVTEAEAIQCNTSSENGVDVTFWDQLAIADDVIEMNTSYYNIGTVLSMIDALEVWPLDVDGNRLGCIDPALFSRTEWSGSTSINGIPTPQAFANLFAKQKGDIPTITYDSGGMMMLSVIERGSNEVDLIIDKFRIDTGEKVYDLDIKDLRGVVDYSRMATRITGRGDLCRIADTYTLNPAWDESLNEDALDDPSLIDTDPKYADVGKLYTIPASLWPYNAEAGGSGNTFEPTLWARRNTLYDWVPINNDGQLVESGIGAVDPLRGLSTGGYTNGNQRQYRFSSPQIWRNYTEAQQEQRQGGSFLSPESGFLELQLTAIYQGSILTYDTGYRGDYPIRRRRILRNREYSKLTAGEFFRRLDDTFLGRQSAVPQTYDSTAALQNECEAAIEVTSKPFQSLTAILTRCKFNLAIGTRIKNIYDTSGTLIFEDVGWIIEGITYWFNTGRDGAYTTELQFDTSLQDLLGGMVLS